MWRCTCGDWWEQNIHCGKQPGKVAKNMPILRPRKRAAWRVFEFQTCVSRSSFDRRFVYDGSGNMQTRGLVVLLLSKTAGPGPEHNPDVLESMVSGIYPRSVQSRHLHRNDVPAHTCSCPSLINFHRVAFPVKEVWRKSPR